MDDNKVIPFKRGKEKGDDISTLVVIRRLIDSIENQEIKLALKTAWIAAVAEIFSSALSL